MSNDYHESYRPTFISAEWADFLAEMRALSSRPDAQGLTTRQLAGRLALRSNCLISDLPPLYPTTQDHEPDTPDLP